MLDTVEDKTATDAPALTPAEKRDARRAAKALKKLEAEDKVRESLSTVTKAALDQLDAEDKAGAAHKKRVRRIALENGIPTSIADQVAEKTDPAVIKPAATNKQLIAFIERVEAIELELAERSEDRKQIYAEARSCGFDVPTMKKIVALRKMDEKDRLEADALLDTYMRGVGMTVQTEMGF